MERLRRLACLLVPHYAVAAAIRAEPGLRGQPVVVLSPTAPARVVVEATPRARARGVRPGMTEAEVLARPRGVLCRERVPAHETDTQGALLEVAHAHSPRVEEAGPGLVYLDVAGLEALFGDDAAVADRLRRAAVAAGLAARVGIAGSRAGARLAARLGRAGVVIARGEEAARLAPASLALLDLSPEMAARLARWGLQTLGELAALPPADLHARLGPEGPALAAQARGEDPRPLRTSSANPVLEEHQELDWECESLPALAERLGELGERMATRLARVDQAADRCEWVCRLADRTERSGALAPAVPTREAGALLPLLRASLQAALGTGPLPAAVTAVTLRAWPVRVAAAQEGLTERARPNPRALAETLARVVAAAGAEGVGEVVLLDSHRPDSIELVPFDPLAEGRVGGEGVCSRRSSALAVRRIRPLSRAAVRLVGGRPVALRSDRLSGRIVASAGPWRASGEWWSEARWARDEWDAELADGTLCRLAHDGGGWYLDAIYD
ncbi:MAG: DNA polymerase Y family protein [Candidatus Rokubacteria bacterium]|nr:DNA polymerase Y family protein [Candidatus Rokubacteria bacterium]